MIQSVIIPDYNKNCLLAYSFDTYPTPLQVSPDDDDKRQHGIITVVVSNRDTQPVDCEQIKITLPVGDGTSKLTATSDTLSAFVYSNDAAKAWEVSKDQDTEGNRILIATPNDAGRVITSSDSLVFYIYYIQVNKQIGNFSLDIEERTSEGGTRFAPKRYTQSFSKFPHGFFFKDLAVYKETQGEGNTVITPITELDNSGEEERVTFAWHGASNATYTLFYSGQQDPNGEIINGNNEGGKTWWSSTEPIPIRDTTTFVLKASVKQGSEPLEAYLSTTVVVNKPEIKALSLRKSGDVDGTGKVKEAGHGLLPAGSIIKWSGKTLPEGWALCDGTTNNPYTYLEIPDLRDHFIVGAGSTQYEVLAGGGSDHVVLEPELVAVPEHDHGVEEDDASQHKHNIDHFKAELWDIDLRKAGTQAKGTEVGPETILSVEEGLEDGNGPA